MSDLQSTDRIHRAGHVQTGSYKKSNICDICRKKYREIGSVTLVTPAKIPGISLTLCAQCARDMATCIRLALMDLLLFPEEEHKR